MSIGIVAAIVVIIAVVRIIIPVAWVTIPKGISNKEMPIVSEMVFVPRNVRIRACGAPIAVIRPDQAPGRYGGSNVRHFVLSDFVMANS